jgi:S1-C subfamily serine protease
VQIIVPVDGQRRPSSGSGRGSSAGSGSVLTGQGHILTNFHVVGDPDTGRPYNRQGLIYVAVSPPDLKGPPEVRYIAELMQSDRSLDLALIKIVAGQDGGDLPADLNLTTMPVGDSDTVKIGDELSIIGFPGLGGATVTFTRGSVSGFLTDEGWIKTDAEINPGNSGGAAINRAGQLVGIPSAAAGETVQLPGKIGLVRPVNLARPLIDQARREAGERN